MDKANNRLEHPTEAHQPVDARRISKSTDPGIDHGHQKDHSRALDAVARPLSGLGPILADGLDNDEFGPPRELS